MKTSIALIALLAASPAAAQNVQKNWQPSDFKVHCATGCPDASLERKITDALKKGLTALRAIRFDAPKNFGERVAAGTPSDHLKVYAKNEPKIAYSVPKCSAPRLRVSHINVGQSLRDWKNQLHLIFWLVTHELFHIIQYGYVPGGGCGEVPGWVMEGTADVVSHSIVRKDRRFKNLFPAHGPRLTKAFAGHRSYKKPLNTTFAKRTGHLLQYRTSSFWRHLGEAYHGDDYHYLHDYLKVKPTGGDWLGWLSTRLLKDDKIKSALPLVYAGFLADYAGWGDKGFPGQFFKRELWLAAGFEGCYTVELSPGSPEARLTPNLRPTSGTCIIVKVKGLAPTDHVVVKAGAIFGVPKAPGDASETDQLQLSWAASSDREDFHCARWIRGKGPAGIKGKMALGHCVFVGDTGDVKIAGKSYPGRIWNAFVQQPKSGGSFESVYILSRTAVSPSDNKPAKTHRLGVTIRFLLDFAQTTVDGKAASKKTRTVQHLNSNPTTDTQESVPMFDSSGAPAITYTNPAQIRPSFRTPAMSPPKLAGIHSLSVQQIEVLGGQPYSKASKAGRYSFTAMPVVRDGKSWKPRPLQLGDKGSFRVALTGADSGKMVGSVEPGTLVVEEFTTFMLRARFQGTVCDVTRATKRNKCPSPKRVSTTMTKAFAGLVLPENRFTIYDTPGTAQFRATKEQGMASIFGPGGQPGPGGPGAPSDSGGPGSSDSSGSTINGCDCSCEALQKTMDLASNIKPGQRPSKKVMRQIQQMGRCAQTCVQEYAACKPKRTRRRKR